MAEEWRVVAGYDMYEVSNIGNVRRTYKNGKVKILKLHDNGKGYKEVKLYSNRNRKAFKVHRLVAIAFIELVAGKLTVDHIDRDRSNNDVNNLRWADMKEQSINTRNYREDILETDPKLRLAIFHKEYREANREQINAKKREYHAANKEKANAKAREKIQCECGVSVSRVNISTHKKTNKHTKRLLDNLINEN